MTRILLVLSLVLPIAASAQEELNSQQYDRKANTRVKALTNRLQFRESDPADRRRYYAEMKDVTARLRDEIDGYVRAGFEPTAASDIIESRLRAVLSEHRPHPDYGDLPLARAADLRGGPSLLLAYTIVRPPHHDSATIRGYRATNNGFELVATEEDDFDGYGMFKRMLPSPLPGELWLMAWGQAHTFNGSKVRFRIYAFDGVSLRTIWSPEDMFEASVRFTDSGFAIDHVHPRVLEVHDEYVLTSAGPVKTVSK